MFLVVNDAVYFFSTDDPFSRNKTNGPAFPGNLFSPTGANSFPIGRRQATVQEPGDGKQVLPSLLLIDRLYDTVGTTFGAGIIKGDYRPGSRRDPADERALQDEAEYPGEYAPPQYEREPGEYDGEKGHAALGQS